MALSCRPQFQYTPLTNPAKDVRLLRLVDKQTDLESPINLELKYFSSDSLVKQHSGTDPPYVAVSYEWGPSEPVFDISVNGARFPVRSNLRNFLESRQREFRNRSPLDISFPMEKYLELNWLGRMEWFWIDAICINQEDTQERNAQIRNMREIFTNSKIILAWIGPPDDSTLTLAMTTIQMISSDSEPLQNSQDLFKTWKNARAIINLANHSYWTRRWVIPEILLSNGQILSNGVFDIAMGQIQDFWSELKRKEHPVGREVDLIQELLKSPMIMVLERRSGSIPHGSLKLWPICKLLDDFRLTECRFVHDQVFALLSLASDKDHITVDYDRSLDDLLFEVLLAGWEDREQVQRIVSRMGLADKLPTSFLGDHKSCTTTPANPWITVSDATKFQRISDTIEIKIPEYQLRRGQILRSQPLLEAIIGTLEFCIRSRLPLQLSQMFEDILKLSKIEQCMRLFSMSAFDSQAPPDIGFHHWMNEGQEPQSTHKSNELPCKKTTKIIVLNDGSLATGCELAQVGDFICNSKFGRSLQFVVRLSHPSNSTCADVIGQAFFQKSSTYPGKECFGFIDRVLQWIKEPSWKPAELAELNSQSFVEATLRSIDYAHDPNLAQIEEVMWLDFSTDLRKVMRAATRSRRNHAASMLIQSTNSMAIAYDRWDVVELARGYKVEVPFRTVSGI